MDITPLMRLNATKIGGVRNINIGQIAPLGYGYNAPNGAQRNENWGRTKHEYGTNRPMGYGYNAPNGAQRNENWGRTKHEYGTNRPMGYGYNTPNGAQRNKNWGRVRNMNMGQIAPWGSTQRALGVYEM